MLEDKENWKKFLLEHGVCVIKNVLSSDEVVKARGLYWDKIESLCDNDSNEGPALDRNDITTWTNDNWPSHGAGFTTNFGISQCEAAWNIRTN